jgi:hypothetical protein
VSPLESWVRYRWKRSIDFLWTFQIICSRVALLLNRATNLPAKLEKCCINTGIVPFETHILCVSSWIMGEGQMEKIYWLLMNFPDNLLTSCTSIEQSNLPTFQFQWKNILYQHRYSDIPNTHIMCLPLNHGWQNGKSDLLLFMNFPDKFAHELHFYWAGQPTFQFNSKNVISTPG